MSIVAVNFAKNFDGTREVTTPLSLEACRIEGVLPVQLLEVPEASSPSLTASPPKKRGSGTSYGLRGAEADEIRHEVQEQHRQRLLQRVVSRYNELKLARASKPQLPSLTSVPPSNRKAAVPKTVAEEAAHYFLIARDAAETQVKRQQKWDEKVAGIQDRRAKRRVRKCEQVESAAQLTDAKQRKARDAAELYWSKKTDDALQTVMSTEEKIEKIRTIPRKPITHQGTDGGRRATCREEQVLATQQQQLMERREQILGKISAAERKLEKRLNEIKHEGAKKEFKATLKQKSMEELAESKARADEHAIERLKAALQRQEGKIVQLQQKREAQIREAAERSEAIKAKKAEVDHYLQHLHLSPGDEIRPPKWLQAEVAQLEARRTVANANSGAQTARVAGSRNESEASGRMAASTHSARPPAIQRPEFSIRSNNYSSRQTFATWMYQDL